MRKEFYTGHLFDVYRYFGAHKEGENFIFRVFAPSAKGVCVFGEFSNWTEIPMYQEEQSGVYVSEPIPAKTGQLYKYCIYTANGGRVEHCDPYGFQMELRPGDCSILTDLYSYKFKDEKWMKNRTVGFDSPVNIYEIHAGSWRKKGEGKTDWYTYIELAKLLIPYVKKNHYTHIEMMPLSEHPFDGSWGYQNTGFFAPTARYGTPDELKKFVDECHQAGIGVIMDFVPVHFAVDYYGLKEFDGTCLYEHLDPRQGEHPHWGTLIYNYGRPQVANFLIANALFWIEHFHVDGLRVDAVASMLYLDYGKQDGQWVPNKYGGNQNLEAIEFFKHLNSVVLGRNPGTMMIAEESTAWPKVTGNPEDDGLGFSLKWNMGWMHDFTEYMKLDPYFRKNAHHMMTFSMEYAYSENYILVLSHDEVVHLKCSMLNKMPGEGFDKYANLKAAYAFMTGHPGKKLLFMGQEFAQLREWSEERELDWFLLSEEPHQQIQNWYRDLLHLYKKHPALYELDNDPAGFEWINKDDIFRSIFSFVRHSKGKKKNLLFVCNFTPVAREDYRVGVPTKRQCKLVLNSDEKEYGGSGEKRTEIYKPVKKECDGQKYSFAYPLPAYGVAVFEY